MSNNQNNPGHDNAQPHNPNPGQPRRDNPGQKNQPAKPQQPGRDKLY